MVRKPSVSAVRRILRHRIRALERCSNDRHVPYGPNEIHDALTEYHNHRFLYKSALHDLEKALYQSDLEGQYHSVRKRVKDYEHLVEKLSRKFISKDEPDKWRAIGADWVTDSKGTSKGGIRSSLGVTDLGGIRILHVYKQQWEAIHDFIFRRRWNRKCRIVEATANVKAGTPKEEIKKYETAGLIPKERDTYTSLHYTLLMGKFDTLAGDTYRGEEGPIYIECQVRTVFEDGWGEVDHSVKYPFDTSRMVQAQLNILSQGAHMANDIATALEALSRNPVFIPWHKEQQLELSSDNIYCFTQDLDWAANNLDSFKDLLSDLSGHFYFLVHPRKGFRPQVEKRKLLIQEVISDAGLGTKLSFPDIRPVKIPLVVASDLLLLQNAHEPNRGRCNIGIMSAPVGGNPDDSEKLDIVIREPATLEEIRRLFNRLSPKLNIVLR